MELSALISLILVLVIVGVALYMVERFIPMSEPIKILIRVVVVIACVLYLLRSFGIVAVPLLPR